MIRRLGLAVITAGVTLAGLANGTAAAASECGDFHWIGAAGSGQRDAAGLESNGGMGGVIYQSYLQLRDDLAANGQTITAEAVQYPAAPVPVDGGVRGWLGFMDSVNDGTAATVKQFDAFTAECPNTKVVLAGYSQGAMVIHRNLQKLAADPHVAAALLIADGDRLPADTTLNMGSTALLTGAVPDAGKGVAQEHSFLASAPTSPLTPAMGARTVSVCDIGDPVCDANPSDSTTPSAAAVAIHTSYAPETSGAHAWVTPIYTLVAGPSLTPTTVTTATSPTSGLVAY